MYSTCIAGYLGGENFGKFPIYIYRRVSSFRGLYISQICLQIYLVDLIFTNLCRLPSCTVIIFMVLSVGLNFRGLLLEGQFVV